MSRWLANKWLRGTLAIAAGCAVNYLGDRLLGVRMELWWGLIHTFTIPWVLDVFLVPFLAGTVVGLIYGLGGKWLCYFPPLIVRFWSYIGLMDISRIPEGASLLPMGWWGFFVILAVESAAFGGVAGEILVKRTYGRMPRHLYHKAYQAEALRRQGTEGAHGEGER
ncbi:MAG: hypothetical protein D6809_04375 [Gammaproteobacteria bacterium]|nr:MAG: hypothetical protein D6809_04375 [Gammaproteobacteria bacterium]